MKINSTISFQAKVRTVNNKGINVTPESIADTASSTGLFLINPSLANPSIQMVQPYVTPETFAVLAGHTGLFATTSTLAPDILKTVTFDNGKNVKSKVEDPS